MKKWSILILIALVTAGCSSGNTSSVSQTPSKSSVQEELENPSVESQSTELLESSYKVSTTSEDITPSSVVSFEDLIIDKEVAKEKSEVKGVKGSQYASESSNLVIQAIDDNIIYYDERDISGDKIYSTGIVSYSMDSGELTKIKEYNDKDFTISELIKLNDATIVVGYRTTIDNQQELTIQTLADGEESRLIIKDEQVTELLSYKVTNEYAIFMVKTHKEGDDDELTRTRLIQYDRKNSIFSFIEKPENVEDSIYYDQDTLSYAVSDDNKTLALMITQSENSYLFIKEFGSNRWSKYTLEGEAKLTGIFYGSRIIYETSLMEKDPIGSNYMIINAKTGNKKKVDNVGELNLSTSKELGSGLYVTFGLNQLSIQKYQDDEAQNINLKVNGDLNEKEYTVNQILVDQANDTFYFVASPVLKQKGDLSQQKIYRIEKNEE